MPRHSLSCARTRIALLGVGSMMLAATPDRLGAQLRWTACDSAIAGRARCGTLSVPESRAVTVGRTIEIAFSVVRASGATRGDDPVLVLLGGPGDAASNRLAALTAAHAAVNLSRDVVFVDQRGVGRSSPLPCRYESDQDLQSYIEFLPADAVRACVTAIEGNADASRYRTVDFIADLEDLRRALGVRQWNLHGSSYGTRVALQYMARHPASVRAAVLVGVVPPRLVMPVPFGHDADRTLAALVADCRQDQRCASAFPNLASEIDSVARRLERSPAQVDVIHPTTGAPARVTFTRAAFGETVRATMYTPAGARGLPLAIHEAFLGNYVSLANGHVRRQRTIAREGWNGLYLAVTCAEDIARADRGATLRDNRSTTLGDYRARQHFAACAAWPGQPTGDEWPRTDRIRPPVLMIVGDADPVTPPYWAHAALETMDRGRVVTVPRGGHGFLGMTGVECLGQMQAAFFSMPDPSAVDASCVAGMQRLPFLTAR